MSRQLLPFLSFVIMASCIASKGPAKKCYRNTKTIVIGSWMGKMTDSYLKLNKGNYFQYYKRLMGLSKIEEHFGTYTLSNDTLNLNFCNGNIPDDLIGGGYIDNKNKEIVLYGNGSYNQHFAIRVDKR
jgi:hypothetical protein